jgi:hypothetical protein
LKNGKYGRFDNGLQIENSHESERVARDGGLRSVVDVVILGPALHLEHKRPHAPILLAVGLEQVRIANANVVVQVDVTFEVVVTVLEFYDGHFGVDHFDSSYECFLLFYYFAI